MRQLLPDPVPSADLLDVYGRDWIETGGLRVNFVASLDGAVTVSGLSAPLQTPGDNAVFAALRDLADVVLVGRGTITGEGYGVLTPTRAGPPPAVISASAPTCRWPSSAGGWTSIRTGPSSLPRSEGPEPSSSRARRLRPNRWPACGPGPTSSWRETPRSI